MKASDVKYGLKILTVALGILVITAILTVRRMDAKLREDLMQQTLTIASSVEPQALAGVDVDAARLRGIVFKGSFAYITHTIVYLLLAMLMIKLWTSRKLIREQNARLARRQERMDMAIKAGKLGFWDWNISTQEMFFSPEFFTILGYDPNELPMRLDTWTDLLHPEERDKILAKANECVAKGQEWDADMRLLCKDGGYKWVSNHIESYTRDKDGQPARAFAIIVDIDKIRRAEDRVLHLSSIVEQSSTSIIEVDKELNIIYMNRAAEELSGYTLDETRGKSAEMLVAQESLRDDRGLKWIAEKVEKGKPLTADFVNVSKSGCRYTTQAQISPLYDKFRNLTGYVSFETDVTEQRRQQEELENFFNVNLDLLCIADMDGRFIKINVAWADILGYEVEELENQPFLDFVHPDDVQKTIEAMAMLDKQVKVINFVNRYRNKDGEYRYIEWRSYPVGNRIYASARDLTEHIVLNRKIQEQERKYRGYIESAPYGIMLSDMQGSFVDVNPAMCRMFGYSREEFLEMCIPDLMPPDKIQLGLDHFEKVLALGSHSDELVCTRKDGTRGNYMISAVLLDSDNALAFIEDVTEKKMLSEQVNQMQRMESIGRLAGGIAHDYNNMLYVILGNAEMITDDLEEHEHLRQYLDEIKNAAQRSATLTRQLLGFASKQTVVLKTLDINQEIAAVLKMLQQLAGDGNRIDWVPGEDIPNVRLDPSQLDQILTNLVTNARDAIGTDLGRIEISTQKFTCSQETCRAHPGCIPGDFVVISVKDNGCGIPESDIEKIFEPFYTTKDMGNGIGLGLATLHGIAKQNQGFIAMDSKVGEGSEFKLYLPAHTDEAYRDEQKNEVPSSAAPHTSNLKVLLVEDEESILEMASRILEKIGCQTAAISSPHEAIRIANDDKYDFDVLLTDYAMPEMNGKDLAESIAANNPHIKILFMSGFAEEDIISESGPVKDALFIQKPFTKKDLADKLSEIENKKR